jgi:hypothetical protein
MAFIQSQLDGIEAAIASGTLTVEYDGKRLTYRSMSELIQARDMIQRKLSGRKSGYQAIPMAYRRG